MSFGPIQTLTHIVWYGILAFVYQYAHILSTFFIFHPITNSATMIDLIKNIVSIIVKLFEVFPQWWKQRQEKNVAKLRKEKMELMLDRAMIRKKLDKAETQEERDELNKIYFNINNRIRYINILLHEN